MHPPKANRPAEKTDEGEPKDQFSFHGCALAFGSPQRLRILCNVRTEILRAAAACVQLPRAFRRALTAAAWQSSSSDTPFNPARFNASAACSTVIDNSLSLMVTLGSLGRVIHDP
jgi:hypothetical protein